MSDKLGDLFPSSPTPPVERENRSAWRWAIPVALFVAIIVGITWVRMFLKGPPPAPAVSTPKTVDSANRASDLQFVRSRALWEKPSGDDSDETPEYVKEYEPGIPGAYDFPFWNPTDHPVTLGFAETSCDCSELNVARIDEATFARVKKDAEGLDALVSSDASWKWEPLQKSNANGLDIPARSGGVVRIGWNGRKGPGAPLNLNIKMWMQPKSEYGERSFQQLQVPILMSEAVRFQPAEKLALGAIGANGVLRGSVTVWSPTRTNLGIKVDESQLDPLFQVKAERLEPAAAAALEKQLRAAHINTKVLSAYRVNVEIIEHKGDRQLDQGPLSRLLPITVDDHPRDLSLPQVTALVKGDVEIGVPEDMGKLTFKSFPASLGAKKVLPLWSDGPGELILESHNPVALAVKLKRQKKESTPTRTKWLLEVTVPPNGWQGAFYDDAVIILRTTTTPPRKVRIPIVGNAGQG